MSNFVETFKQGKLGSNIGLNTGIDALTMSIHGIQRRTTYSIAAAPKCGKTTLVDYSFILSPYLQMEKEGRLDDIEWIYFSYEIDRISKEFKFAAFFMAYDYEVYTIDYKDKKYGMSQDYLMGKLLHKNETGEMEVVPIELEHEEMLKQIYINRIIPLLGEYDTEGNKLSEGKIQFIEDPDNPTGMDKYIKSYARLNGTFKTQSYYITNENGHREAKSRISGYTPNNPNKFTIIVTDHVRKLRRERGFDRKENIDKWLEYSTYLRNFCSFTFVHVIHSNRSMANVDRLKYAGEFIFPTADDCKDSGNPAEESTIFMTLFNPNDEKYNLNKHFGVELKNFPNYRSLHITESRYTDCPVHIQMNMLGGVNMFTPLNY